MRVSMEQWFAATLVDTHPGNPDVWRWVDWSGPYGWHVLGTLLGAR